MRPEVDSERIVFCLDDIRDGFCVSILLMILICGLQTLCEQLRQENNELRKKMEEDLQYRNRDLEQLR